LAKRIYKAFIRAKLIYKKTVAVRGLYKADTGVYNELANTQCLVYGLHRCSALTVMALSSFCSLDVY